MSPRAEKVWFIIATVVMAVVLACLVYAFTLPTY